MIIDDVIDIVVSNNQIKYYRERGYETNGNNEILKVKISDLSVNSGVYVNVKCDICGKEKKISMHRYKINTKNFTTYYACSRKCAELKNKETIKNKYNIDNISKLKEIKIKKENTCLKNNGVKYPQQSEIIRKKTDEKKNIKYSNKNYNNIEKRNETIKNIMIEKYNAINYEGGFFHFKCNKNHIYKISHGLLLNRIRIKTELCTICNPINSSNISGHENQLKDFIIKNYDGCYYLNDRSLGKELDIYLPDLKLAFEFNGLYWHNELHKEKNYHLKKTNLCKINNIHLIHIYEDDWIYKQDIIKSMILNKLKKTPNKIYARKTKIKEITDNKLIREFLNKNHIQGYVGSSIKIGLFYENELVSLMTLGKKRIALGYKNNDGNDYELLRFCNKQNTNVIGGVSKLFKYFKKNYSFDKIISYADRSYSNGSLYNILNFDYKGDTNANYYYIIDNIKRYRYNYRKDKLVKEGYDPSLTEHQIMLNRKIYRIYDSGNTIYELNSH